MRNSRKVNFNQLGINCLYLLLIFEWETFNAKAEKHKSRQIIYKLNIMASSKNSQTSSVTGSKHSTKTVTKAGKADKRTKLGGAKK